MYIIAFVNHYKSASYDLFSLKQYKCGHAIQVKILYNAIKSIYFM